MIQNVSYAKSKKKLILFLNLLTFLALSLILFGVINIANIFNVQNQIIIKLIPVDILFGIFIYLKTSVDFVVFSGSFIKNHKKSSDLGLFTLGTSLGNGAGMFLVVFIWAFIKNVKILLALSVLIASGFLIFLGSKNLLTFLKTKKILKLTWIKTSEETKSLEIIKTSSINTFLFSIKLPFILGIDDFAGYIPLFNILNITSFSVGVLLGHFILTSLILINEKLLRRIVEFNVFDLIGGAFFLGIGVFGIIEIFNFF